MDDRVIIIAEIGECFNGDLGSAEKLISVAKQAGCDIVKFQTLDYENISQDDPEKEWFKKISLNPKIMQILIDYSGKIGIQILFTPENVKTAKWILEAGREDIKIASSLIIDTELLKFVNAHFKRVFVSTGMASLSEVKKAVKTLHKIRNLYILHCVSEYPTGPLLAKRGLKALAVEDVHFNMMKILIRLFPQYKVGYSDHTFGILVPIAAVAAGAKVIEKHITLDRTTPLRNFKKGKNYLGTDHILSLEPDELKDMVYGIREVEKMFGGKKWKRSEGEKILRDFLRSRFQKV